LLIENVADVSAALPLYFTVKAVAGDMREFVESVAAPLASLSVSLSAASKVHCRQ
jgi:hypothetical protein